MRCLSTLLWLALILAPTGARAEDPPADEPRPTSSASSTTKPTATTGAASPVRPSEAVPGGVGLVLGGGGARGAAHIGVLRVLERERIPIRYIAGTSMGAIIGSFYAAGYDADEIEAILLHIDWKDMFDDDPRRVDLPMRRKDDDLRFLLDLQLGFRDGAIQLPRGLIQGQKLLLFLRRMLLPTYRIDKFDDLPIPFRCVGTDIGKGEAVIFDGGDLALAVRASMSVPAAYAPIRVNGRLMVDGGISNNLPYDVARDMGAGPVIVVNVGEPLLTENDLDSPVAVTLQMISALMARQTNQMLARLRPEDVLIVPELGDISSTSFDRVREAIAPGQAAAEGQLAALRRFAVDEASYAEFKTRHRRLPYDAPLVEFIDVVSDRSRTAGYVSERMADVIGKRLDPDELERRIGQAYGYGKYERIGWIPVERDGQQGIEITPVDKGWGPNFLAFSLQLSDDFNGRDSYQLVGEATVQGFDTRGAEWRSRVSLGEKEGLRSEYFQPFGARGRYWVQPALEYEATDVPLLVDGSIAAEYRVSSTKGEARLGWTPNPTVEWSTGLLRGRDTARQRVGLSLGQTRIDQDFGGISLGFARDTFDDAQFPTQGSRLSLRGLLLRDAFGSDGSGESVSMVWDKAWSVHRHNWLVGARAQTTWGEGAVLQSTGFLGGLTNLSGFGERELFGDQVALLRGVYYRRFGDMTRLFSLPAYIGGSVEAGNVWSSRGDVSVDSLIYSGSVFVGIEGPFGPILFGYGHADTGDSSWYLNFGSLLRQQP